MSISCFGDIRLVPRLVSIPKRGAVVMLVMRIDFAAVPHVIIFPSGAPAYLRADTSHRTDRQKIGIYIEKNFDICYSMNISEVQKPTGKVHPCSMLYQTNKFNRVHFHDEYTILESDCTVQIIHGDNPVLNVPLLLCPWRYCIPPPCRNSGYYLLRLCQTVVFCVLTILNCVPHAWYPPPPHMSDTTRRRTVSRVAKEME